MIHNKFRYILTLALLFCLTTGAWAADTYTITFSGFGNEACNKTVTDATLEYSETFNVTDVYAKYEGLGGVGGSNEYVSISKSQDETQITITVKSAFEGTVNVTVYYMNENWDESERNISVTCVKSAPAGTPVALNWDATAKTATLTNGMPAGNVTVSVEYYPQASAEGAVTAATGVKATTDAPLVTIDETQLTGVAKMMYYASTDATAPAYDAEGWTDKVPTAENYTQAGTVNVWYYPVGTDEGVGDATATYSDGDMNTTALAVTLGAAPKYNAEFDLTNAPEEDKAPGVWSTDITGEGVKKGTPVTVTYTGTKKVLGVKAEKKATKLTITIPATENAAALTLDVTGCTTWEQILDQNVTTLDYEGDGVYGQTSNCYILDGNNNRLNLNTPYDPTTNYHWGTQR